MWVSDDMKERARQVNLIRFLQARHPELIFRKRQIRTCSEIFGVLL